MSLIGALVGYALTAFILLLIARMVLDWSGVLANGPQWASRARELSHAWTEPVIAPVRQVLRPVRAGGLSIDLAFTAVFIAVLILRSIALQPVAAAFSPPRCPLTALTAGTRQVVK